MTAMAFLAGFRAARLVDRVNRNMTTAVRLMQSRRGAEAIRPNEAAIRDVVKLIDLEPDDLEHHRMLGSLYYNGAAIYEQVGRLDMAVAQARLSLLHYELLPGGRAGPEDISNAGLASIANYLGPTSVSVDEALDAAAYVADVKARLARLLARHRGSEAETEVHELGRAAVASYERLVVSQPRRSIGLERVQTQYRDARNALAGG
jgi:hypothetical protein